MGGLPENTPSEVAAIAKILSDPAIRTENPLEVKNLLYILYCMSGGVPKIPEAIPTFIDYMSPDSQYLAWIGKECVPFAIGYFADSAENGRKIGKGESDIPAIAAQYFQLLKMTDDEAAKAVEDYKLDHPGLTAAQLSALDEIITAIQSNNLDGWKREL